jgi:hypothetical protein
MTHGAEHSLIYLFDELPSFGIEAIDAHAGEA